MIISLNSYTSGGSPNAFGREIAFDSSYLYTGGHLLIEIRHDGFTGTSRSVDAIGTTISGYGTLFSACWTGSFTGTSGTQGNFSVVSISVGGIVGVNELTEIPGGFNLAQNYPNPFNPVTKIEYYIPFKSNVEFSVFNLTGKKVSSLLKAVKNPGHHFINFDAGPLTSGVYFYTLKAETINAEHNRQFTMTRKMLVVK